MHTYIKKENSQYKVAINLSVKDVEIIVYLNQEEAQKLVKDLQSTLEHPLLNRQQG